MKDIFANPPTPTLFDLFITDVGDASAIDQKRYVRQLCEAIGSSIDRRVRYRMTDDAGQKLVNGQPVSVPGFVIFAECADDNQSFSDDKQSLMATWWTGGGYEQVSPYRVARVSSHAPAHECSLGADIESFVTNTLGLVFVTPDAWIKRDAKRAAAVQAEAERQERREAKAQVKAQAALAAARVAAAAAGVPDDALEAALAAEPAEQQLNEAVAA